jgi:anti-sigma B factor antagonist
VTPAKGSSSGPVVIPTANDVATPSDAATSLEDGLAQPLKLTVQFPCVGVCAVRAHGEVDMLTAPLLDACLSEQLATGPAHVIVDLQLVRFFGCTGLTCLLKARDLAGHIPGTQLHLAGLVNRTVARPLLITALLERFDTYPTLAQALATLTRSLGATPSAMKCLATD